MNKSTNTPALMHTVPTGPDQCMTWTWCVENHSDESVTWHSSAPIDLEPTPFFAFLVAEGDADLEFVLHTREDEVLRCNRVEAEALVAAVEAHQMLLATDEEQRA